MIVRISNEDQFRIPDEHQAKLDELDNAVVTAVEPEDEPAFHARFEELLDFIRGHGVILADDEIETSQIIVPPADLSFDEAHHDFNGDGLVPD